MTAELRKEYTLNGLNEADLAPDPMAQFHVWFNQAIAARLTEPNAMILATATPDGRPAARIVLLKSLDRGFVFYTNYAGRKGRELAANPWAALCFYWTELERQVRIEGHVEMLTTAESDAYFASRPRESQLGAWASSQTEVIPGREVLEQRMAELNARFAGNEVNRPPNWGGYRVLPDSIEFWQGRVSRLHDRLCYTRQDSGVWVIERLSP